MQFVFLIYIPEYTRVYLSMNRMIVQATGIILWSDLEMNQK